MVHHTCMKNRFNQVLLTFTLITLFSACTTNYITPLGEIADPNHPEIASIRLHTANTYMVMYNPDTCKIIGGACGFFRAHAFAHYQLQHPLMRPRFYTELSENQADCYAAKYGKPDEVKAAVELFLDKDRGPTLKIYGDPIARAQNIVACAKQNGNWTGS